MECACGHGTSLAEVEPPTVYSRLGGMGACLRLAAPPPGWRALGRPRGRSFWRAEAAVRLAGPGHVARGECGEWEVVGRWVGETGRALGGEAGCGVGGRLAWSLCGGAAEEATATERNRPGLHQKGKAAWELPDIVLMATLFSRSSPRALLVMNGTPC
jgi:hypothetical protein